MQNNAAVSVSANDHGDPVNKKTMRQTASANQVADSLNANRQQQTQTVEDLSVEQEALNNEYVKPVGKRGPGQDNRNE